MSPRRPGRRRDEGGAVLAMVAVMMVLILATAALAVDLGVQRVARRDMQAMADVVALDMVRQLDGRTQAVIKATSRWRGSLADSVRRNLNDDGTSLVTAQQHQQTATATVDGSPVQVAVTMGLVDPLTGVFTAPIPYPAVPNAVRVTADTSVDFAFAPGSGGAARSAVASTSSTACFDLGSYAAAIDSGASSLLSPLNDLLGLNLGLVSYQGLAAADVTLAGLAADSHIGSVDRLLGGSVSLGDFIAATISVLGNDPTTDNSAAVAALGLIRVSGIDLSGAVDLAGIVSLAATDGAALQSTVNVLDLVSGAIQVANGEHALELDDLDVLGITGDLYVTQGIQRACGVVNDPAAHASSSQIAADLTVPLSFPTGASVLGLTVTGSARVTGGVGNAEGQLVGPPAVTCRSGTTTMPDTYRVDVNGGLLGLGLRADVRINGTVSTGLLGGLVDNLLGSVVKVKFNNVSVSLGADAPGTSPSVQHADLEVPQNALNTDPRGTPVRTGSAFGGVGTIPTITTATATSGTIEITTGGLPPLIPGRTTTVDLSKGSIGSLVTTLLGTVNGTLSTVVNTTLVPNLNALLVPLSRLLGLNVGGADVYGEFRPTCNGARLVG